MKTTSKIMIYISVVMFILSLTSLSLAQDSKDSKKIKPQNGTVIQDKEIEPDAIDAGVEKDGYRYVGAILGLASAKTADIENAAFPGSIETKPGFALGAAVGFGFNYGRMEAEVSYQQSKLDRILASGNQLDASGNMSHLTLLINGYFDFKNRTAFTPYLSAGMGVSLFSIDAMPVKIGNNIVTESTNNTLFAYQFGAGVGYAVTKRLTIDLKYRYFATSNPNVDNSALRYKSNNIYLGGRFTF